MSLFTDEPLQDKPASTIDGEVLWQQCQADLLFAIDEKSYRQWIAPLQAQINSDNELVLFAPNMMWLKRVKEDYLTAIVEIVAKNSKQQISSVRIEVLVDTTPSQPITKNKKPKQKTKVITEGLDIEPAYTFDAFVKGKSNASAYNACNELSKKDSKHNYGPIFIYGSSGLGKTHLMHAMANRHQKYGKSFCYFTKESFYQKVLAVFREKKVEQFVKNVSQADLLIIDDVHLFDGVKAPKVTDILMNLFDIFHTKQENKQVMLASDRPPSQLSSFGDRYVSRLSSCLLLPIEPPDMEMRLQILEKKAAVIGIDLPKECALYMAQNLPADVRALEGALKSVSLLASLIRHEQVSLPLVKDAIKDKIQERVRALNAESIRGLVAEYYGVSLKDLMGKKRDRHIARPRQMAMALIRELTHDSLPEIGQVFGGRDHTTVMHACDKINELRQSDASIEKDYTSLKSMLEHA